LADYTWPVSLPSSPLSGTLRQSAQDAVLRGPADAGEGEIRLRFSAVSKMISFVMLMTTEQVATLEVFFASTLSHGVSRFNFVDPVINETKEFRFQERYSIEHSQHNLYRVSISLIRKAE